MAALTGRTVSRFIRFCVDYTNGTPAEIPIDSISPVGFTCAETEQTAFQDAVKGYLSQHPDAPIDITGPFDTSAIVAISATTVAPALSGSHTVLSAIVGLQVPLGLAVMFGMRTYWEAGAPVFGVVAPSATSGYICTKYTTDGEKYQASFRVFPGTTPAWGTAIIS
jgi:hypothetical protein